jgi:hypothetical protein
MIIFENQVFTNAREINLKNGVIDLINKYGGGFFTKIPISDEAYRKTHKTKYNVKCRVGFYFVEYEILDDWGKQHIICISNDHDEILQSDNWKTQKIYKKEENKNENS